MFKLTRYHALLVTLIAAAVAAGGCGSGTQPTQPAALSQDNADAIAVQVGASMGATNGGSMAELAATAASIPSTPQSAGISLTAVQAETTFTIGSITYTLTRTFYDALGQPMAGWGPTAVRVVVTSRASGSVSTARFQATVGHSGSLDVRGINALQDSLTFNGFAYDTAQSQFHALSDSSMRYLYVQSALTYLNVKLLKNRSVNPWPLSGTASWSLEVDRLRSNSRGDIQSHLVATVVVVFNGTQNPDVTVNGSFHYKVNLLTGDIVRA